MKFLGWIENVEILLSFQEFPSSNKVWLLVNTKTIKLYFLSKRFYAVTFSLA